MVQEAHLERMLPQVHSLHEGMNCIPTGARISWQSCINHDTCTAQSESADWTILSMHASLM